MSTERKVRWRAETQEVGVYQPSGSQVTQLTSLPAVSHVIYCEQPYCTADGKRFVFTRYVGTDWYEGPYELWLCDIERRLLTRLAKAICREGMAGSAYGKWFYAVCRENGRRELVRFSLETLERESVFDLTEVPPFRYDICTVSPDYRHYVSWVLLAGGVQGLIRLDLREKSWQIIHEAGDIYNTHMQFSRPGGEDILLQQARGWRLDEEGLRVIKEAPIDVTLYVIDRDGGNRRPLPFGRPHTESITGHECWVGETNEVACTIAMSESFEPVAGGNLRAASPGDKEARIVARGHCFLHLSVSRDGRFFVCDAPFEPGTPIVVGSMRTGRHAILCEAHTHTDQSDFTHAHPYFTGDAKHVIFNSTRTGLTQLYAATVPAGLLESLE